MVQQGRNKAMQNKHRAQIARAKPACHICGKPIDYSLKWPDPQCFVVDHVVAIANGGSDALSNKKAAHHPRVQRQEERSTVCAGHPTLGFAPITKD